jgi:hypothetical protein
MVFTDLRLSPACTARAAAQRGQRRTADLIPDWLTFPTELTLHRDNNNAICIDAIGTHCSGSRRRIK